MFRSDPTGVRSKRILRDRFEGGFCHEIDKTSGSAQPFVNFMEMAFGRGID